jgi:cytochrome c oxidase accessory protein FixG
MNTVIDTRKRGGQKPPQASGEQQQLYKKRDPIHPKKISGSFRTIKWALLIITLTIYYVTPWIRWQRPAGAPDQAVLVDFVHGRFYFFDLHLWPDEVYFITGILVISALALFLVTSLFGRLWCGYACPQTVWTDLYIFVERIFEGDRNARLRLNSPGWSFNKAFRKLGKHIVWLVIAMATGGAWIFYFHDAPELAQDFFAGKAAASAYIFFGVLTFTTYSLAGTMREQVCVFMCPWPRIQGAMIDSHTLQVAYRYDRGEPRGPHKKGDTWDGRGDCIDCNQCVVVCPMGIDIRNGLQLECINCGLCIDACDEIMKKVERPTRLIAYDTIEAVAQRTQGQKGRYKLLRGRTLYYAIALALVGGVMVWGFLTRPLVTLHSVRDRNPLFVTLQDGSVRDGYLLTIANRTFETKTFKLNLQGVKPVAIYAPGVGDSVKDLAITVAPDETRDVKVFVTVKPETLAGPATPAVFTLTDRDGMVYEGKTVFDAPQETGR